MDRSSTQLIVLAALGAATGCTGQTVLDEREGAAVIVAAPAATMTETDHVPAHGVVLADADGHEHRLPAARAAALWPRSGAMGTPRERVASTRVVAVDAAGRLLAIEGGQRRPLLDHVVGAPVVVDASRVIAARETSPGETDLWIVGDDGAPPRALAAAPGADDSPSVLADGRVAFVSGRSGVAAVWLVDADPLATPRQLTNHGEVPGALSSSFVPPPAGPMTLDGHALVYGDEAGTRHTITIVAAAPVATPGVR